MDNLRSIHDLFSKINPQDFITMGMEYSRQKKYGEALLMFEAYLAIDPWNSLVINNKADCFVGMNRLDEAIELVLYALTLNPKLGIGWCTLGEIQSLKNKPFSARLCIELALKLTPEDNQIYPLVRGHLKDLDEGKDLKTNIYL